ncbi:ankyrin repeat domain-containing protein [Lacimicrobium alkaliphilum]|uniref:Uncharacterized protein n=1 Tax=Lacimicrobium alkaliphilum TaxID=1526571 RepID=A0ABQ1QYP1_9ALTE|nr:ankyrin repeat domain-containing protein [Lacimicrobium alkaliphilum]GGD50414.1 hypothetical protein GCM10011357_02930 [Lacimicrobium alkaliphilum]
MNRDNAMWLSATGAVVVVAVLAVFKFSGGDDLPQERENHSIVAVTADLQNKGDTVEKPDSYTPSVTEGEFVGSGNSNGTINKVIAATLKNKLAFEKAKEQEVQSLLADAKVKTSEQMGEGSMKEMMLKVAEITQAAHDGDWELFLSLYDELALTDSEMMDLAIHQAISMGAPLDIIEQLLDKGASIPPQSSLTLAVKGEVARMKELLPLGLDLYSEDPYGRNAVSMAAMMGGNPETVRFLLDHNVPVKSSGSGRDALDFALERLITDCEPGVYVDSCARSQEVVGLLLDNGGEIESSHGHFLAVFRSSSPEYYTRLVESYPGIE